jgi:hypothetical protein
MTTEQEKNDTSQSENIRDKLKKGILSLTDKQAEYIWEELRRCKND